MDDRDGNENPFQRLYMRVLSHNLDVLSSILDRLFMEGQVWTILTPDLQLRVLEEEELSIDPVLKASISNPMARTPYVTVRGPEPAPPAPKPKEAVMPTEYERRPLSMDPVPQETEVVEEEKDPPKPEKEVIPIEDLDKIEKLLDVSVNTIDMPNLPHIKQACMEELKQIDDALGELQTKAQEEYQKAMDEWNAEKEAKARKKAEERAKKEKEEKEKAA